MLEVWSRRVERTVTDESTTPRRLRSLDVIEQQHELLERLTERSKPASAQPAFKVAQVKATGGNVVHEWEVSIPVCDEYPTAQDAFDAQLAFAATMLATYPPPTNQGGHG